MILNTFLKETINVDYADVILFIFQITNLFETKMLERE